MEPKGKGERDISLNESLLAVSVSVWEGVSPGANHPSRSILPSVYVCAFVEGEAG